MLEVLLITLIVVVLITSIAAYIKAPELFWVVVLVLGCAIFIGVIVALVYSPFIALVLLAWHFIH